MPAQEDNLMQFDQYIDSLEPSHLAAYAKKCGTSVLYIKNHLRGASRVPRPTLLNKLWQHSQGKLTRQDVLDHFFPRTTKKTVYRPGRIKPAAPSSNGRGFYLAPKAM